MPEEVTKEWLERIGLSPNLATRNLHGLRYLGLITEGGYTTEIAERLRVAPAEEFPTELETIIRKAYAKIFALRDPSTDARSRIDDAFRHESPAAQRSRMVACFLGLCAFAGIPLKEAPPSREVRNRVGTPKKKPEASRPVGPATPSQPPAQITRSEIQEVWRGAGALDPALAGIVAKIPEIETREDLERWWVMFKSAFEFVKKI
jgi:hypothetical protein